MCSEDLEIFIDQNLLKIVWKLRCFEILKKTKELSLSYKLKFLITILLQPDRVNLRLAI